jgi:hypothetical protein
MQLSSDSVLQIVNSYVAVGNYPQAYQVVLDDLTSHYPNPSTDDQSVLSFLNTAIDINSGADTLVALAVRANNVAAMQYEKGVFIAMFGPEQQAASDAVARAFFSTLNESGGTVQDIDAIAALRYVGNQSRRFEA